MSIMSFDAVIIGSGLGGLTAGALLAKAGYSVCLLERKATLGGAASCYRLGTLTVEASLHQTANPLDTREIKHSILKHLDLLDKIKWPPVGNLHEVQGRLIAEPFSLPRGFTEASEALTGHFPAAKEPIRRVLGKMEKLYDTTAKLNEARRQRSLGKLAGALTGGHVMASDWNASVDDIFTREFGDNEAVKLALAANLLYYSADPKKLWWMMFAVAQGGYLGSGGVYVRGGSRVLAAKLSDVIKEAGGTVLPNTAAATIELNSEGAACAVVTAAESETPPQRLEARVILAASPPQAIAGMLPDQAAPRFSAAFEGQSPSTTLFAVHLGLKENPARFGLADYSVVLLPSWMNSLRDYPHSAALLGANPGGKMPLLCIANYGAINSGLNDSGGPTLVSVVGLDDIANWRGLSKDMESERRNAWLDAILIELEQRYPGFAGAVSEKTFLNAASMERYLGTPGGAIYGFDPIPPTTPFWKGRPRTPRTPIPGLFLASSWGGASGFSGAMGSGEEAAELAIAVLQRKTA